MAYRIPKLKHCKLSFLSGALSLAVVDLVAGGAHAATQVGQIFVCYACNTTGNASIDAALAANPSVASDGILFAFVNSSGSSITGGTFSVSNASPDDSVTIPTIASGGTYILLPGLTNDGGVHPSGGLFANTGFTQDTSDGEGGVTDASIFKFVGLQGALSVTSQTAGASTAIAGTFTAGDPGLFQPYRDNPANGQTSFLGLGPNGDGPCSNCYFNEVATLDVSSVGTVPEPAAWSMMLLGFGLLGSILRRGREKAAAA